MMISVERVTQLGVLVVNGEPGQAEDQALNDEELAVVARLRIELNPVGGMIASLPTEFDFSPMDSPEFDSEAWEADGMPMDDLNRYVKPYKPKPYGWLPFTGEES
jgi:hypothetical protein